MGFLMMIIWTLILRKMINGKHCACSSDHTLSLSSLNCFKKNLESICCTSYEMRAPGF